MGAKVLVDCLRLSARDLSADCGLAGDESLGAPLGELEPLPSCLRLFNVKELHSDCGSHCLSQSQLFVKFPFGYFFLWVHARWCLQWKIHAQSRSVLSLFEQMVSILLEPKHHSLQGHSDHRLTRAYDQRKF